MKNIIIKKDINNIIMIKERDIIEAEIKVIKAIVEVINKEIEKNMMKDIIIMEIIIIGNIKNIEIIEIDIKIIDIEMKMNMIIEIEEKIEKEMKEIIIKIGKEIEIKWEVVKILMKEDMIEINIVEIELILKIEEIEKEIIIWKEKGIKKKEGNMKNHMKEKKGI